MQTLMQAFHVSDKCFGMFLLRSACNSDHDGTSAHDLKVPRISMKVSTYTPSSFAAVWAERCLSEHHIKGETWQGFFGKAMSSPLH